MCAGTKRGNSPVKNRLHKRQWAGGVREVAIRTLAILLGHVASLGCRKEGKVLLDSFPFLSPRQLPSDCFQ